MSRLQSYLACLFLGMASQSFSQQLSLFSQYRENQTIINPAAVGSSYLGYGQNLTFGTSYRVQWQGFEGAPTTANLRGDFLYTEGSPVSIMGGGYLINDQTGPTGFTGLYGRIGGVLSDDPYYGGISVGLSFGMVQYRVNTSDIRLRQSGDILSGDDQNKIFPDVGVGVFAYRKLDGGGFDGDYVYGGISVPQVIGLDLMFQDGNGEFYTRRIQHFYGMLGFYKFFKDEGFLEPSVWVKYAPNAPVNADFNLRYQMAQSFWIGVGGSTSKAMHVEAGFLLGENLGFDNTLRIGYGYDYSFSTFGPYTGGAHEINISYALEK
ncbi:MAG: PorP/SprF family type IX secretion system membrane protein [Bacteroidetes bacterium]|nr:PorP/SprF family type IX secretion system membrane protein [Bacteroidota bacterium]